jgi:hypothetical protein
MAAAHWVADQTPAITMANTMEICPMRRLVGVISSCPDERRKEQRDETRIHQQLRISRRHYLRPTTLKRRFGAWPDDLGDRSEESADQPNIHLLNHTNAGSVCL